MATNYYPQSTTYGNITINTQGTSGLSGYVYTSGGTGATNWSTAANPMVINQSGKISLTGANADLDINGVSLKATLESIQEMLGVMRMDPALEKEFEELKAAGERYRELREKFTEQKAVWDTLKNKNL